MKAFRTLFVAASMAAFAVAACAQPKPAGPAASGPGMGMGMGAGMGGGGMHYRAGADNTYGWGMMTPQEREAHQKKMMDLKSPGECKAYMDQHHQQMVDRAKQRGSAMPGQPPRDMCEGLK